MNLILDPCFFCRHRGKHAISWLGTAFGDHGNSKLLLDIQNPLPPPTVVAFAFHFRGKDSCHICLGHPLCQQIPFLCQQNVNVSFFSPTPENNECMMMLVRFFLISTILEQVPYRRTSHTNCHTCQIPGGSHLTVYALQGGSQAALRGCLQLGLPEKRRMLISGAQGTQPISAVKTR